MQAAGSLGLSRRRGHGDGRPEHHSGDLGAGRAAHEDLATQAMVLEETVRLQRMDAVEQYGTLQSELEQLSGAGGANGLRGAGEEARWMEVAVQERLQAVRNYLYFVGLYLADQENEGHKVGDAQKADQSDIGERMEALRKCVCEFGQLSQLGAIYAYKHEIVPRLQYAPQQVVQVTGTLGAGHVGAQIGNWMEECSRNTSASEHGRQLPVAVLCATDQDAESAASVLRELREAADPTYGPDTVGCVTSTVVFRPPRCSVCVMTYGTCRRLCDNVKHLCRAVVLENLQDSGYEDRGLWTYLHELLARRDLTIAMHRSSPPNDGDRTAKTLLRTRTVWGIHVPDHVPDQPPTSSDHAPDDIGQSPQDQALDDIATQQQHSLIYVSRKVDVAAVLHHLRHRHHQRLDDRHIVPVLISQTMAMQEREFLCQIVTAPTLCIGMRFLFIASHDADVAGLPPLPVTTVVSSGRTLRHKFDPDTNTLVEKDMRITQGQHTSRSHGLRRTTRGDRLRYRFLYPGPQQLAPTTSALQNGDHAVDICRTYLAHALAGSALSRQEDFSRYRASTENARKRLLEWGAIVKRKPVDDVTDIGRTILGIPFVKPGIAVALHAAAQPEFACLSAMITIACMAPHSQSVFVGSTAPLTWQRATSDYERLLRVYDEWTERNDDEAVDWCKTHSVSSTTMMHSKQLRARIESACSALGLRPAADLATAPLSERLRRALACGLFHSTAISTSGALEDGFHSIPWLRSSMKGAAVVQECLEYRDAILRDRDDSADPASLEQPKWIVVYDRAVLTDGGPSSESDTKTMVAVTVVKPEWLQAASPLWYSDNELDRLLTRESFEVDLDELDAGSLQRGLTELCRQFPRATFDIKAARPNDDNSGDASEGALLVGCAAEDREALEDAIVSRIGALIENMEIGTELIAMDDSEKRAFEQVEHTLHQQLRQQFPDSFRSWEWSDTSQTTLAIHARSMVMDHVCSLVCKRIGRPTDGYDDDGDDVAEMQQHLQALYHEAEGAVEEKRQEQEARREEPTERQQEAQRFLDALSQRMDVIRTPGLAQSAAAAACQRGTWAASSRNRQVRHREAGMLALASFISHHDHMFVYGGYIRDYIAFGQLHDDIDIDVGVKVSSSSFTLSKAADAVCTWAAGQQWTCTEKGSPRNLRIGSKYALNALFKLKFKAANDTTGVEIQVELLDVEQIGGLDGAVDFNVNNLKIDLGQARLGLALKNPRSAVRQGDPAGEIFDILSHCRRRRLRVLKDVQECGIALRIEKMKERQPPWKICF